VKRLDKITFTGAPFVYLTLSPYPSLAGRFVFGNGWNSYGNIKVSQKTYTLTVHFVNILRAAFCQYFLDKKIQTKIASGEKQL
jgi:hypothetical protein